MDQRPDPDRLPTLVAEWSRPEVDLARLRITLPTLGAVARQLTAEGTRAEHQRSTLTPVGRVASSPITTSGQQLLRVFNPHASLPADRIATASALLSRPAGSADDNP